MTPKEAKEFFEKLKTAHELPNDNSGEYNQGYVAAMNIAINTVKKCDLADVGERFDIETAIRFRRENGKYLDAKGNHITTEMVMKYPHYINEDFGVLFL